LSKLTSVGTPPWRQSSAAVRILYIVHNHPAFRPGGSEIFAYDLFQAVKQQPDIRALFLACTGEPQRPARPGTMFQTAGRSADEMLLWTGPSDLFTLAQTMPEATMAELERLLREFRPEIVHFHHYLLVGIEALALVRRCLPQSRLVVTLHDYYAICAHDGLMVTSHSQELCETASPDACRACFPKRRAEQFVLRRLNLLWHFSLVDVFLAPSEFLRQRYIAWGLPSTRLVRLASGRALTAPAMARDTSKHNAFAFFGNLSAHKGILVALEAARRLVAAGMTDFTFDIFGGVHGHDSDFPATLQTAVAAAGSQVRVHGRYRTSDLAKHLAAVDWVIVPSIWWENAPLVIMEALLNGRPVICSGVGGMAELVEDGRTGLHFRVGDPDSLARTMCRAVEEQGLWDRLASGVSDAARSCMTIEASAVRHLALYRRLLAG
jgi:glycosyltransferase involved in cell wall biosynthesis